MSDSYLLYPYLSYEKRYPVIREGVFFIPEYYPLKDQYESFDFDLLSVVGSRQCIAIEFCSGTGDWIIESAKQNKDTYYIAVERKFKRVCKIADKREKAGLDNLFIVCGNAETFIKYFIKQPVFSRVYVNFPDPWPKTKHEKHRLFSSEFVSDLELVLKPEASLMLVTDDRPFVLHAKQAILSTKQWTFTEQESSDCSDYGTSYFHSLWLEKGRQIYFNQFHYQGSIVSKVECC